jgi:hypothetical protein
MPNLAGTSEDWPHYCGVLTDVKCICCLLWTLSVTAAMCCYCKLKDPGGDDAGAVAA